MDRASPSYEKDRRRANKSGLPYRVRGVSWWEQELPSVEEMQEGTDNLEKINYCVDFVVTHCLSGKMQERLQYRQWFCGHYHVNRKIDAKHTVLYEDIV